MNRLVIRIAACAAVAAASVALQPSLLRAQRGAERTGQTIVIRAQVPTPQVITVRPRTVPEYSREVLGSEQRQRSFWGSLLPAYQLVTQRQIDGRDPLDSAVAALVAGAPPGAPGAPAADAGGADSSARAAEIAAVREEIAERRARLDSLERAIRGAQGRENAARSSELPALPKLSPADSAARAQEIDALFKALEFHRARLDSLEAVVRSLGRPGAQPDSLQAPRDSTRSPR
ncbi:MAG TPA: hypothetical protein VFK04_10985 [Gemmatimonadaceae bacterium]|nr:hypothetical protein [Gemmatimonadaceae bacterium]